MREIGPDKNAEAGQSRAFARFAPWLALWGCAGVIRALVLYASLWLELRIVGDLVTWAASAATAAGLLAWLLRGSKEGRAGTLRTALPVLMVFASVVLLDYVHAVDAFFMPMFRTLVLAVAFVYAGVSGIRGMLALGLWLFAAAVVFGVWYLGYSPIGLEGLSGLALLAAAAMVRRSA